MKKLKESKCCCWEGKSHKCTLYNKLCALYLKANCSEILPMKRFIVPYDIAKLLRDKGFNKLCNFYYIKNTKSGKIELKYKDSLVNNSTDVVCAPTYTEVNIWLFRQHKLLVKIPIPRDNFITYKYEVLRVEDNTIISSGESLSYQQAEYRAYKEALKLIKES